MITATVPAKLNLSLAVTGKRGGMHTLDMIVYPYEKYADVVEFFPVDGKVGFDVFVKGGFDGLDKERFSAFVCDKFEAIAKRLQVGGKIEIFKGVPLGAGLGGSSASIACVYKAAIEYLREKGRNMPLDVEFLLSLGSDVPYMVHGGVCRVSGVGEVIEELESEGKIEVCEIIAEGGSDSGKCYKLLDELCGEKFDGANISTTIAEAIEVARNDLFEPACILNPQIKTACEELKECGFDKIFMSGSGSAVFAISGFVKQKSYKSTK